jgi:hypothetical protein
MRWQHHLNHHDAESIVNAAMPKTSPRQVLGMLQSSQNIMYLSHIEHRIARRNL